MKRRKRKVDPELNIMNPMDNDVVKWRDPW
jgi:hypothetical protein